jgi:hypothetical protein
MPGDERTTMTRHTTKKTRWYVLEWNALDYRIELYEFESRNKEQSEAFEEISEDLHNYSSILLMDKKHLHALFKAVRDFHKRMKRGGCN